MFQQSPLVRRSGFRFQRRDRRCQTPRRWRAASASAAAAGSVSGNGACDDHKPTNSWQSFWSVIPPATERKSRITVLGALRELSKLIAPRDAVWVLVAVFLLVGGALCELAVPHFVAKAYAAIIASVQDGTLAANLTALGGARVTWHACGQLLASCPALVGALGCLALVNLGEAVMNSGRSACLGVVNHRLVGRLRAKLFANLASQEVMFFVAKENNAAALSSRLSSDCLSVTKLLTLNLNVMLRQGLQGLGGLAYLATMNVPLAIGCGLSTLVMGFICVKYGLVLRRAMSAMQDALADSTSVAEEALSSIKVVRSMGYETAESRRYGEKLQHVIDIGIRITAAHVMYMFTHTGVWYAAKIFVLTLGGAYALGGVLTPPQLTAFVMYVDHVLYSCLAVCEQFASVLESIGATDTVFRLLHLPPALQVAPGIVPQERVFEAGISFQGVSFTYPSRTAPALSQVTLTLPEGTSTAIVGRSGSGKSTLVQLLTRQADPTAGRITLGGLDLRDVDAAWFRRRLSIVPQEPGLFSTSVYNNIAYGLNGDVTEAQVRSAAAAANAAEFIEKLPFGYDTYVSDGLLSGGQRQRIAVARALVRQPKLIVLDEATSSLDAESESAVQAALQDIMRDRSRTVVVISHRLATVRDCDQIVVLDGGRVAELGTHPQLMRARGIYHDLVTQGASNVDLDVTRTSEDDVDPEAYEGRDEGGGGALCGPTCEEEVCAVAEDMSVAARREGPFE